MRNYLRLILWAIYGLAITGIFLTCIKTASAELIIAQTEDYQTEVLIDTFDKPLAKADIVTIYNTQTGNLSSAQVLISMDSLLLVQSHRDYENQLYIPILKLGASNDLVE